MPTLTPSGYSQDLAQQFKPEKLPVGWPWRLFTFSGFLFLAAILVFTGLAFGYDPFLNSQIKNVEQQQNAIAQKITPEQEANLIRSYSQVANVQELLQRHVTSSPVFTWLESITHPRVYFQTADMKVPERQLVLDGAADSFQVLSEQLTAIDRDSAVSRYMLNQSQFSEGAVQFKITITFKESIF
ncbi:MAG TPA: hypothetical protein VJH70_02305 [Candidatus Paceibacterota bacterium]